MIDLNIRVKNPNVWAVKARDLGFMEQVETSPAVLDENGNITTPEVLEWQYKEGVYVDEIETIWITPPTFDTQGVQITNGTKAQGRHFNIRITNPEVEANWATLWTNTYDANGKIISRKIAGAQAATPNKTEKAWRWQGVEFVDMTTVNTPNRVWLGSV